MRMHMVRRFFIIVGYVGQIPLITSSTIQQGIAQDHSTTVKDIVLEEI